MEPPNPSEQLELPPKYYRIGDIVRYAGLSRQTIHNYTTMGLIREVQWTPGGHRLYDESVFYRLRQIAGLKRTKTITQIRRLFEEQEAPA
ncbi:MAG: MerR family transcriptional regulator [Phycisphaerae bacterium]|nr:MerR family transcriptional regulator [Phycisphaerae bacterium]